MDPAPNLTPSKRKLKKLINACLLALALIIGTYIVDANHQIEAPSPLPSSTNLTTITNDSALRPQRLASEALETLSVKGRAPKTGYSRLQFGSGWAGTSDCDTRNQVLGRDLTNIQIDAGCQVSSGILSDPYTGNHIQFNRGRDTSEKVQIDHVVALSDAWQKGAQQLTPQLRLQLANDPLNLLAVDGGANQNKSDGDAVTWLPPNKSFRCAYVARQISVKLKYTLWVNAAEKSAMQNVLKSCPDQQLIS